MVTLHAGRGNLLTVSAHAMSMGQGTNGEPTGRSIRTHGTDYGIAYGARALRQRSRHSSQRTGKPSPRRRAAGDYDCYGKE